MSDNTTNKKAFLYKTRNRVAKFALARQLYFLMIGICGIPKFIADYLGFKTKSFPKNRFSLKISDFSPQLFDNTNKTNFDPHYTYHPAWAARIVAKLKPTKHVDVSSIVYFSTLVSAFVPVEFYDYRPAEIRLPNLQCKKGDLISLPFPNNSVESISCMHTIEHVGLGRYGDQIDPDGDIKATGELVRVVKPGGTLLFVAPVGKPRIEFNAHRVYSYEQVMDLFQGMKLQEFSLVPDDFKKYGLIKNADPAMVMDQSYACGCFWFVK
jgi:SAM-dependent methyltransferase